MSTPWTLPTWDACADKDAADRTALEHFVYLNTPGAGSDEYEPEFRERLTAAILVAHETLSTIEPQQTAMRIEGDVSRDPPICQTADDERNNHGGETWKFALYARFATSWLCFGVALGIHNWFAAGASFMWALSELELRMRRKSTDNGKGVSS